MNFTLFSTFLPVLLICLIAAPLRVDSQELESDSKKYKFLYYAFEKIGSHGNQISQSGKALVRQGHHVSFLTGADGTQVPKTNDNEFFSFIFYKSDYTEETRRDVFKELSSYALTGYLSTLSGIASLIYRTIVTGKPLVIQLVIDECDALLRDTETMARLRSERFDMLVADDFSACGPIVAEALDIPFVHCANWGPMPVQYERMFRVPTDPSYIPSHHSGFTDRMTLSQRLLNYINHWTHNIIFTGFPEKFQELKVKYNIKPEVHITESMQKASLWVFNRNYPLEFPRPLQPNTIMHAATIGGKRENYTLSKEVSEFVEGATEGVVLFSLGGHVESMELGQAQMFADGFARLPQRVIWQSKIDFTGLRLGKNTKLVDWLPLRDFMTHKKIKVFVTQGGACSMHEGLWAGLPMVVLPLLFDMFDNTDRAVAKGFAVSIRDITSVTSETLYDAVSEVVNNPKYRENALHNSAIMKDLMRFNPPAETIANWILHVTKFGGDHLRPAIYDLNFIQRNLIDVYLILLLIFAAIGGGNALLCYFCCTRRRSSRPKRD